MITRYQDWPELLATYLRGEAAAPFAWGTADCVTLAAGAVEAMTGIDPIASIRGTWTDEASATVAILALGQSLNEAVAAILAPLGAVELTNLRLAARGDIVTIKQGDMLACGVVAGASIACRSTTGFAWLRLSAVAKAWRI